MRVRRVLVTLAAAALLVPVAVGSSTAAPAAPPAVAVRAAPAPLITIGTGRWLFSPNHDGRRDTARRTFVLARQARVVVRVLHGDRLVRGPVRLGALRSGRHAWRWDGRANDALVVDDGHYMLVFRARRGERTTRATASAMVDTTLERGTFVSTRPTVYPSAAVVSDQVELAYLQPDWNEAWDLLLPSLSRATLVITGPRGEVVRRRSLSDVAMPVFDWFARRDDGSPLPAGEYAARLTIADAAGNQQVFGRRLTVSHEQLVEEVWTTTQAAADVDTFREFVGGCNGCTTCRPAASSLFQGGLSFPPCDYESAATAGFFATDVPFAPAPVDEFRITATGGPTEPGASDTGNLYGTQTTPGDTSTTSGWVQVALSAYPQLPEQKHPAWWWFQTRDGSSYDIATFTVEYRHYVSAG